MFKLTRPIGLRIGSLLGYCLEAWTVGASPEAWKIFLVVLNMSGVAT